MNQTEFAAFAMALKTYYPRESLIPNKQAMELWYEQLQDIPNNIAQAALKKWVAINKWSPTIADIREMAVSVRDYDTPDWSEEWDLVLRAISKYGWYGTIEAMASLKPMTREVVRRLGFRNLCMSENISADRANFRDTYNLMVQREKQESQMPLGLLQVINQIRIENKEGHDERKAISTEG